MDGEILWIHYKSSGFVWPHTPHPRLGQALRRWHRRFGVVVEHAVAQDAEEHITVLATYRSGSDGVMKNQPKGFQYVEFRY